MRNHGLIPFVAATLLLFSFGVATCADNIGFINSDQVLREYAGARDLDAQLEASVEDWRSQTRTMESEIDALITELQNQRLLLSEEAAMEKERSIQEKRAAFEEFLNQVWGAGGMAAQREAELWQPVFDRVKEILEEIGVEGEYQMIFDSARMGIVYAAPTIDLTQQVLDRLNGTEE